MILNERRPLEGLTRSELLWRGHSLRSRMWRRLLLGAITACCRNQARSCPMSRRRRRAHCRRYSRRRSCQLSTAAMQHQHRRTLQSLARERPDYCDGACNEPTCASNRLRANDHAIRTNMNAIAAATTALSRAATANDAAAATGAAAAPLATNAAALSVIIPLPC